MAHNSSNSTAAVDGGPHRVNSPRYSGSMTRRAHSFKRKNNNNNNINEIELQINSPRSPLAPAEGSLLKRNNLHHHHNHHLSHKEKRNKFGQWVFFLFCGVCLFVGLLKICATAWWFRSSVHSTRESVQVSVIPRLNLIMMR